MDEPLRDLYARDMGGADTRGRFDDLVALYAPIAAGVFVVVLVALVVPLVRNRASRGRAPSARHSAIRVEVAYALGLGVIAALLVWRTFAAVTTVDGVASRAAAAPGAPASGLTIRVDAARWNWRFGYPGGVVEQTGGRSMIPTLVLPAGETVRFRLRALDVVHAFWIPATRYKYDATPGRVSVFDLALPAGVDYSQGGRCSEFCGEFHDEMRFDVDVRSPAAFDAWLARRQAEVRTR